MKIVGFAQLHEELRKGNLENWFRSMAGCDCIYVWDQASRDGSLARYAQDPRVRVVANPTNDFARELECKAGLLELLLREQPDCDWILWLDGDTILDGRLLADGARGLRDLCARGSAAGIGGWKLGHYNLWRSDAWYRTDNQYHWLHGEGVPALWRNNGRLQFPRRPGLHVTTTPDGLGEIRRADFSLIHRGFADDAQILEKHRVYGSRGQRGWDLDRLLDERTLAAAPVPPECLPAWYEVRDGGAPPAGKRRLVEIARGAQ